MADRPSALITYDGLPVSSGGAHRLRLKDRRLAWHQLQRFLALCATREEPDDVRLLLGEGGHVDSSFFDRAQRLATSRFGTGSRRRTITGASTTEHEHSWSLTAAQIEDALGLMDKLPSIPEHLGRGLLVLSLDVVFLLRDPRSGSPLSHQGADLYGNQEADGRLLLGESRSYVRLSSRSTWALFLSLPFAEVTHDVLDLVASLQAALPFRLSPNHWARWQLNVQGTSYYKRRLSLQPVA